MNILQYGTLDSESYCIGLCACEGLAQYMLTYKLPEDITISATTATQVVTASAKNRYLRSVTINAVTKALTVTPTTATQTFVDGPYANVTVQAIIE